MPISASDVPGIYDLVFTIAGVSYGFIFANTVDQSLPFRVQRATYGYSPTFVDRSNVSNQYGDNAQDFFPTVRQRDWSLGEQQKFFRTGQDGRYWMGQNVDVSTPGQVKLSSAVSALAAFASAVTAGSRSIGQSFVVALSSTKLYSVDPAGGVVDQGAHGLGATPGRFGCTSDGGFVWITGTTAGTVGVRKWTGAAFSTFSATAADSLAFVNNTLYGLSGSTNSLIQYDTGGVATTLFTWKAAEGSATGIHIAKIEPFGGQLLILLNYGQDVGGELWIYDGAGTKRLEVFPSNFFAYDVEVLYGVAYISGSFVKPASSSTYYGRPAVLFYDGNIGKLWQANDYGSSTIAQDIGPHPTLGVVDGRLIFTDDTNGNLMAYDPALGGISTIGTFTPGGDSPRLLTCGTHVVHTRNSVNATYFPATTYPSSGYVISSLIDFESSQPKQFRGVKVEWEAAADGNGGSVDIAYQVDSLTGSWTTLRTGAVSGTEYTFTNISGRAFAFKITLNKGTSTSGPTLKAMSVRGAPTLTTFRRGEYLIDCTGRDGKNPARLRNDQDSPLDGQSIANNLKAAITSSSPISITDRFGTFTGVCEPDKCEFVELRPEEYIARVFVREV